MHNAGSDDDAFLNEIDDLVKGQNLENQLRIGRFKRDISVQTNVSELLPLETLIQRNIELQSDVELVKKDVAVKLKCLEAKYETQIQNEAMDLHVLIQRKTRGLMDLHKERIEVLQKSYQSQLVDAINLISGGFRNKLHRKKSSISGDPAESQMIEELMSELEEKTLEVETLTEQVKEFEEKLNSMTNDEEAENAENEWLTEENRRLEDENEKLKDDIDTLHIDLERLRDELFVKDNTIDDLASDLKQMTIRAEQEKKSLQKVTQENQQLKAKLDLEREAGKKKLNQLKKEMEKEIHSIETRRQEEALAAEEMLKQHMEEKKDMEKLQDTLIAKEVAVKTTAAAENVREDKEEGSKLKELEEIVAEQKAEIQRLQKELRISNRAWEKKFEILRKNFHTIKDEMFLRSNLQRQAAALHYASVSYTLDVSAKNSTNNPDKHPVFTAGTPLPQIGAYPQRTDRTSVTMMSSCVSDSCIDHELQSQHEDGDDEEDFGDLPLPLPPPPNRQISALDHS